MNHSDQSTSEDNFEQGTDSRHSSSFASKKKSNKKIDTDEILEHDLESEFPQSIERTRYNQTNDEGLFASILDPNQNYKKQIHHKNSQKSKKRANDIQDKTSERLKEASKSRKKNQFSDSEPSSYYNSFDDKISFQTMDPKQYSSYLEYPQEQLVQIDSYLTQGQGNSFNKKDKNYFDSHIVEDQNQNQQEGQNNVHIFEQHSCTKLIELENPHNNQVKYKHMNFTAQTEKSMIAYEIDPVQAKILIRQKKNQITQLNEAYVQTINQNEILKNRVKQLEECLQKIVKEKQEQDNFFKNCQFKINQEQFKKTVKIFRKFSL